MSRTMQAVVLDQPGKVKVATVPVPVPGRGQLLVKVEAVAQNPVDLFFANLVAKPGTVLGCDFVGTVVEIGPDVPSGLRRVGERIAGLVNGGVSQEEGGAFAEYLVADPRVAISVPSSLSIEEAAGLGICTFTACQLLHHSLGLPLLDLLSHDHTPSQQQHLLVWSGASAVGQYTIQLAALLGLHVVATASPSGHDLLRKLGARDVVDYSDPDVVAKIRDITGGNLKFAVDCFGAPDKVAACIGPQGGAMALVLPHQDGPSRPDVKEDMPLALTLLGKALEHPVPYPALPTHYADGEKYGLLIGSLLEEGKLKVVKPHVFPGGLQAVQDGFDYATAGRVRAEKVTFVL